MGCSRERLIWFCTHWNAFDTNPIIYACMRERVKLTHSHTTTIPCRLQSGEWTPADKLSDKLHSLSLQTATSYLWRGLSKQRIITEYISFVADTWYGQAVGMKRVCSRWDGLGWVGPQIEGKAANKCSSCGNSFKMVGKAFQVKLVERMPRVCKAVSKARNLKKKYFWFV